MKAGIRALGVAESFEGDRSTLAGVVVRADRVVDGFAFGSCTVGGMDATAAIIDLFDRLDREDVASVFVAGIAPAWYNVVDARAIHDAVERPVLVVTYEDSDGLGPAIEEAFPPAAAERRLATYRDQPRRRRLEVGDRPLFYRPLGVEDDQARELLRAFTPAGGRPEPLRLARQAARAADRWRRREAGEGP